MPGKPPPAPVSGEKHSADEPPPILGTWRRLYAAVLLYLCAFIGVLALFTWGFER